MDTTGDKTAQQAGLADAGGADLAAVALPGFAWLPVTGAALGLAALLIAFSGYSGHMGFWYWGPPPASKTTVIAVGFGRGQLTPFCGTLRLGAYLNNHLGVSDDEQGAPVWVCSALREPWTSIWPHLRDFG